MDIGKREMLAVMAAGAVLSVSAPTNAAPPPESAETTDIPFAVWSAINAITQGYADCVDRFDTAGLVALFTSDCVYDYAPGLVMNGREAIGAGLHKALAAVAKSSHFVGPPVVRRGVESGVYLSVAYFTAVHQHKDGGQHTVCGRYLDTFRADAANHLLIAHRHTVGHLAEGTDAARYWLDRAPS